MHETSLERAPNADDVLVQKMNGAVVGRLNHFSAALRPFVSKAIERRVSGFIGRKLPRLDIFQL